LLVVTPYYNKATQNGVVAHYQAIAQAVNTPLIVYNVPGRTGVNIAPQTLEKIAQIKTVVGYKEACGDISHNLYTQQVCQRNNIGFYSGNDDLNFLTYANRGNGTISVVANVFPDLCVKM
jgi:4-hydroxy-tetrahydrodipicolinate synthase